MALKTERQSVRVSKMKYNGLDQYGAEPFEQQQFGTADAEGIEYNACSIREPCVFGTIIVQETSFDWRRALVVNQCHNDIIASYTVHL